jgi:hypothetical protein
VAEPGGVEGGSVVLLGEQADAEVFVVGDHRAGLGQHVVHVQVGAGAVASACVVLAGGQRAHFNVDAHA